MHALSRVLVFLVSCIIGLVKLLFPSRLEVTRLSLSIHGLSKPVRIVQLSDLHFDHPHAYKRISSQLLDQMVTITNEAAADLIAITGDFVQYAPEPSEYLAQNWLCKLQARYGVYGVHGNHDLKEAHSKEMITQHLAKVNIKILDNAVAFPMGKLDGDLAVIGFCDYTRKQFRVEPVEQELLDSSRPKLILSHNPDSAELLRKYRADLILAGHTHGGQILLPGLGTPLPFLARILPRKIRRRFPVDVLKNWDWLQGLHRIPRSGLDESSGPHTNVNYLYTNRGLATHPPLRFNCRPEITIIELVPAL